MKSNFKVIALTGGIGSGKSTVSEYLSEKGYKIIDADKIAREIVETGAPTLARLVDTFGEEILNDDKSLNRKKLGSIVFKDNVLCQKLNDIMHGEIFKIIKERIDEFRFSGYNKLIFLDVPLLFETASPELYELIDTIWVVDTDDEIRIQRIMKRDNSSKESVLQVMQNQMSSEEKRKRADVVINNSGSETELYETLDKILEHKTKTKAKVVMLILALLLVFSIGLLTGCGEEGTILGDRAAPTGVTEVIERVIYLPMEKVRTLNPMISRDEDTYIISKLVYDSLFEIDHYMMPQKRLVESFYFSDDRLSLHIKLREGILWHDGRDFTANDVRFSIENYIGLGNGTIFADYVANIRAVSVPRGETHSLTISFRNAYNVGVENLVFPILPAHQFPRTGDLQRNISDFEPLGTGPYRVVSFNNFDRLILEPNPYYHGTIPRNNIEFLIFPNKNDALNLVNVGRISLFISDDIERETIVHGMNANAVNFVSNRAEFVAFNIRHELFRDVMIRQAIAYAIDSREILETAYLNSGILSNTIFFPFFFGNENYEELFPHNLERASELLEQAGLRMVEESYYLHDRAGNEVRIGILVNSNNSARMAAAQIIKNALDNLSLYSYIIYVDWEEYITRINSGDFDLYIGGYAFNERFDLRFLLHSRHNNRIGFSNSEVDRLLDKMQSGLSNEEKAQVFQELNAILQQEVPIYCLLYKTFGAISSVSLRGDINPRFNHVFYNPGEWINMYAISAVVAE